MPEVTQRSFTKGEVSPAVGARSDLRLYGLAAKKLENFFVHPEGGISSRAGLEWVGPIKANKAISRLIPFAFNTEQTYSLEFTDLAMRVIMDGGYVTEAAQNIVSITNANPAVVEITGHSLSNGDEIYITAVGGMIELNNGWFTVTVVDPNHISIGVDSTLYGAYTTGGTAARIYTIVSPFAEADLANIKYTQSADVMTFVCHGYDPRELTRTGHAAWAFSTISFAPTVSAPTGLAGAPGGAGGGTYGKTYGYVVTAVDANGVESVASSAITVSTNSLSTTYYIQLTWNAVVGADHYNIYKAESEVSSVYGWIGKSNTLTFKDYNVAPVINDGPPIDRQPFSGAGNKPSTVNYYQQRLMFAATENEPQTVYGTQSGNYKSLRVAVPTKDDDAITFTIASQKVNEVRHIVALDALILLTSGGEWRVTEGQDEVLTPSTLGVRPQSYFGASHVQPAVVGDSAVYIQARGSRVRDISYTFELDKYSGSDLSILAQHMFENHSILELQYSQEPHSQLFLLRDDGVLLVATYHREHEVIAWYRFTAGSGGVFKSICVISEGGNDVLYAVVERSVNGGTVRYVERLRERDWVVAEDAFCVDCGDSYSGAPTNQLSGLRHLEGEEVVVLGDGNVIRGLTVSNGLLNLPHNVSKAIVGLPYTCKFKTLEIDSQDPSISVRGKRKNVASVVFTMIDSRGGWYGSDSEQNLFEIKPRVDSDFYSAIALRDEEIRLNIQPDWNTSGSVYFEQRDPLPVTILTVTPEFDIG